MSISSFSRLVINLLLNQQTLLENVLYKIAFVDLYFSSCLVEIACDRMDSTIGLSVGYKFYHESRTESLQSYTPVYSVSHALYHSSESWLTTITPNCYSLQYTWCSKRGIYNATTAYHWFALYNGPPTWRCSNVNPLSSRKYVMVTHHDALPRRTSITACSPKNATPTFHTKRCRVNSQNAAAEYAYIPPFLD